MTEAQKKRFADALERLAGDQELLIEMASMVVDDAPELMNELECQLQSRQMIEAASTLHKLKGMFSTFETGSPVSEVPELIHAAREQDLSQTTSLLHRIEPKLQQLLDEITELAQTSRSSA